MIHLRNAPLRSVRNRKSKNSLAFAKLPRRSHLNRQNEHHATALVKTPLQLKHSMVMEPAADSIFIVKHQLAGK
ncbi:MAG TPA: hypothetical protein VGY98_10900, partial [Verrucomicrobiae bacterium]|nr:hypothetical protein [Verrucomicrobiae bacterium]